VCKRGLAGLHSMNMSVILGTLDRGTVNILYAAIVLYLPNESFSKGRRMQLVGKLARLGVIKCEHTRFSPIDILVANDHSQRSLPSHVPPKAHWELIVPDVKI
jgi:hypothetical protein